MATPERLDSAGPPDDKPQPSVAGPSFLGLAVPEAETKYLLEDESPSRWRFVYLALALLFATGGILAWRWRSEGHAWRTLMAKGQTPGAVQTSHAPDAGSGLGASSSIATPETTVTGEGAANGDQEKDELPQPSSKLATGDKVAKPSVAQPQEFAENHGLKPGSPSKTAEPPRIPAQESASQSRDAGILVTKGENYLYGNGVQKDCDRARTNLFVAAHREDPDAQSILGVMFATGHCVSVDLPTAYHWLSRAQRGDPANSRIADSLRIVWREMSSEQQQAALRDSR